MHELSITRNVVAIVNEHANGKQVKRVVLAIGASSSVMPDAIHFCFDICNKGTLCEQAKLEIKEIKDRAECLLCTTEFELNLTHNQCKCGSTNFKRIARQEMLVKEIELF